MFGNKPYGEASRYNYALFHTCPSAGLLPCSAPVVTGEQLCTFLFEMYEQLKKSCPLLFQWKMRILVASIFSQDVPALFRLSFIVTRIYEHFHFMK